MNITSAKDAYEVIFHMVMEIDTDFYLYLIFFAYMREIHSCQLSSSEARRQTVTHLMLHSVAVESTREEDHQLLT